MGNNTMIIRVYVKALIVVHANVFYWVGAWNLSSAPLYTFDRMPSHKYEHIFIPLYFFVGMLLTYYCDSIYALGYVGGTCFVSDGVTPLESRSMLSYNLHALLLLASTMFVWLGVFYAIERWLFFDSEEVWFYSGYVCDTSN